VLLRTWHKDGVNHAILISERRCLLAGHDSRLSQRILAESEPYGHIVAAAILGLELNALVAGRHR